MAGGLSDVLEHRQLLGSFQFLLLDKLDSIE